jgi:hypothetical protein
MLRYSCDLVLSGVIDLDEARIIALEMSSYCTSLGAHKNCLSAIQSGERVFFLTSTHPDDKEKPLRGALASLLEAYHISFCYTVLIDGTIGLSQCHIVDRELNLEAHFRAQHGHFDTSPFAKDDARLQLVDRWQDLGKFPPLKLITSQHDAITLAGTSSKGPNETAYLARRKKDM